MKSRFATLIGMNVPYRQIRAAYSEESVTVYPLPAPLADAIGATPGGEAA